MKWGTRKRFEKGIPNGRVRVYGYCWEGDELVTIPEEAAVVKRIYQNFLDGKSRYETEREFAVEGIKTRLGCCWVDSNIRRVLRNYTYTGDLLLQREYISDPITKKRMKNRGELPQYCVADHHEAIIDKETFYYVQAEMQRRREPCVNKPAGRTCFTGMLRCPHCGKTLVRSRTYWKCGTVKKKGGSCPVKGQIGDGRLRLACARAMGTVAFDEAAFAERVEFISVPETYRIEIHMKDGTVVREDCTPGRKGEAWRK